MIKDSEYEIELVTSNDKFPLPVEVVESDKDLYWHIALELHATIEDDAKEGRLTPLILPVGPVFQYSRFVSLFDRRPISLAGMRAFFMDEYMTDERSLIDEDDNLSFRGFIQREWTQPLLKRGAIQESQVSFPDPANVGSYDARLDELGGARLCIAGVGITGHLAFNDPPEEGKELSLEEFRSLPTRVVNLSRETIVINSNTALRGAYERVPRRAVTIGMRQILSSKRIRVYFNRPWQSAVVRKLLFAEPTVRFPATLLRSHPDVRLVMTGQVARPPEFALK